MASRSWSTLVPAQSLASSPNTGLESVGPFATLEVEHPSFFAYCSYKKLTNGEGRTACVYLDWLRR